MPKIEIARLDANSELADFLENNKPIVAINTIGPFQGADYSISQTCIYNQTNYIDLSDGRHFVGEFSSLDQIAKQNNVTAISGASTRCLLFLRRLLRNLERLSRKLIC
ncbi:MAG: hypothetical protein WCL30_02720 [Pseudomonadota bacterium]